VHQTPTPTIKGAYDNASGGSTIVVAGTAFIEYGIALDADKTITIQGAGADTTFVQAGATAGTASDRVFNITAGTITLEDMTIRNGAVTTDSSSESGGGEYLIKLI
jgi:hypothetical protein